MTNRAITIDSHVMLACDRETAWSALVDWEGQAAWMKDADSVRVITERREGVGVRIAVKTRVLQIPAFTEVLEVVVWEPCARLVMQHTGVVDGTGTWTLEPAPGGTRFSWVEELSLSIPLIGVLALRVYRPFMRWLMGRALGELAHRFERGIDPDTTS